MTTYRLQADNVRKAADKLGDTTLVSIARTTGIHRITLSGMMNGRITTGLLTVMRLHNAYGLPLDKMVEEVPDGEADAEPELAGAAA